MSSVEETQQVPYAVGQQAPYVVGEQAPYAVGQQVVPAVNAGSVVSPPDGVSGVSPLTQQVAAAVNEGSGVSPPASTTVPRNAPMEFLHDSCSQQESTRSIYVVETKNGGFFVGRIDVAVRYRPLFFHVMTRLGRTRPLDRNCFGQRTVANLK